MAVVGMFKHPSSSRVRMERGMGREISFETEKRVGTKIQWGISREMLE
jgi:hypothetical protein